MLQAAGNHTARVDQPHEALTDEAAEQPNQAASTTTSTASTVRHLTRAGDAQQFTAHAPEREGCQAPADDAAGTAAQPSQTSIVAVQGADVNLISISAGKSTTPQVGLLPRPPRVKASVAWNSLKALNSGGLALPKLSTAALTTSMCVLASMEQSMEVCAHPLLLLFQPSQKDKTKLALFKLFCPGYTRNDEKGSYQCKTAST